MSASALMGYGHKQESCFDLGLCPDLLVAMVAAMAGLGFTMLYQAVTMAASGRRRWKRSSKAIRHFDGFTFDNLTGKILRIFFGFLLQVLWMLMLITWT